MHFYLFRIDYENCNEILKKFAEIARKADGKIGLEELSNYLHLPSKGPVEQIFNMYDRVCIQINVQSPMSSLNS